MEDQSKAKPWQMCCILEMPPLYGGFVELWYKFGHKEAKN